MSKQTWIQDIERNLRRISASGDPLEKLDAVVDFERLRPILERAADLPREVEGESPTPDVVMMFKILLLQNRHELSLEAARRMVMDRLSWMRFCGLSITDRAPDIKTLRAFRDDLIKAGKLDAVFDEFDRMTNAAGFTYGGGKIVEFQLVPKSGRSATADGKGRDQGRNGR